MISLAIHHTPYSPALFWLLIFLSCLSLLLASLTSSITGAGVVDGNKGLWEELLIQVTDFTWPHSHCEYFIRAQDR